MPQELMRRMIQWFNYDETISNNFCSSILGFLGVSQVMLNYWPAEEAEDSEFEIARTFRSRIFLPQKFARWLISSLCSFSCLNLASSLNARIVARPVKVSEKCA